MLKLADCQAFTTKFSKKVNVLETKVKISESHDPRSKEDPPKIIDIERAIWDTGASCSCISQKVVKSLNLSEIDRVINHTANGPREAGVYLVNIYLPNRVIFSATRVIDAEILGADILIGMDVINKGDLAITHKNGATWMTFQFPSYHKIDFVEEINREIEKIKTKRMRKRNSKRKPRSKR